VAYLTANNRSEKVNWI